MIIFLHFKKKNLEDFSQQLMLLNFEYNKRTFEFGSKFESFFVALQDFFHQIGETNKESRVSQLSIYYETAQKGINPNTLNKLKTGRRENEWISAFYCLTNLSELLQDSLDDVNRTMDESREILSQLILSALQNSIITNPHLQLAGDIDKIKELWLQLIQNQQIDLVDKKLSISITKNDIYILIDDIFTSLK